MNVLMWTSTNFLSTFLAKGKYKKPSSSPEVGNPYGKYLNGR